VLFPVYQYSLTANDHLDSSQENLTSQNIQNINH
jgi:hypothetical protein